ncbi:hypothetical protein BGZ83_006647 [Gryganskiella cystojenkinii]|nr:hypothetical protein BGZ83_006647 [Gryganskiella cystojenkinii]
MTSTSSTPAWTNLFQGLPPSGIYTEEALQNHNLPADELIEKADSNSSLLLEMLCALALNHETLSSFEENDLIQTLHRECQDMSDFLYDRIWQDSGDNGDGHLQSQINEASSSSSSSWSYSRRRRYEKTADEEAQIASFIGSSEKIQVAFRRFDETRDFLQAKEMQAEEEARERALTQTMTSNFLEHDNDDEDDVDDYARNTTYGLEEEEDETVSDARDMLFGIQRVRRPFVGGGLTMAEYDTRLQSRRTHLRKSEEPLVWKLDPREDFKVNKNKMKHKKIDPRELEKIHQERLLEKGPSNSTHGLVEVPTLETLVTPEMWSHDNNDVFKRAEEGLLQDPMTHTAVAAGSHGSSSSEIAAAAAAAAATQQEVVKAPLETDNYDGEEILEGVERNLNRTLHPVPLEEDGVDDDDDEDDAGVLSDDSWEEIPRVDEPETTKLTKPLNQLSIEEEEEDVTTSAVSSSTSSFLLTPDATTSNPEDVVVPVSSSSSSTRD